MAKQPKAMGMSFQSFLKFDPASYQKQGHRNCDCIEFWSDAEEQWAYLDDKKRENQLKKYHAYIRIKADDITHTLAGRQLFTDRDAGRIISFIKRHQGDDMVVHCSEGISRTGAVIYVLDKYFDYSTGENWERRGLSEHYHSNGLVLKKFENQLGDRHHHVLGSLVSKLLTLTIKR